MYKVQRTLLSFLNLEHFPKGCSEDNKFVSGLLDAPQVTCIPEVSIQLCATLCNYATAQVNLVNFILRLEDTDQTGLVPDATGKLQEDLFWAGIILNKGKIIGKNECEVSSAKVITSYGNGNFKNHA